MGVKQTRQQKMAEQAYKRVESIISQEKEYKEQYLQAAQSFPALVHTNGLCQAVSFYTTEKGRNTDYLCDLASILNIKAVEDLGEQVRRTNLEEYMHLTQSVMSAAGWMKRYAQALLKESEKTTK